MKIYSTQNSNTLPKVYLGSNDGNLLTFDCAKAIKQESGDWLLIANVIDITEAEFAKDKLEFPFTAQILFRCNDYHKETWDNVNKKKVIATELTKATALDKFMCWCFEKDNLIPEYFQGSLLLSAFKDSYYEMVSTGIDALDNKLSDEQIGIIVAKVLVIINSVPSELFLSKLPSSNAASNNKRSFASSKQGEYERLNDRLKFIGEALPDEFKPSEITFDSVAAGLKEFNQKGDGTDKNTWLGLIELILGK